MDSAIHITGTDCLGLSQLSMSDCNQALSGGGGMDSKMSLCSLSLLQKSCSGSPCTKVIWYIAHNTGLALRL